MKLFPLLGCATLISLLGGCCDPEIIGTQTVPLRGQETAVWCWAASGEMVMDFLGTDVSQCDEANKRFGRTDCCTSGTRPTECVRTGWPEFDKYGFTFKRTSDAPLTWAQLREQIYCLKKPFAFSWHWLDDAGQPNGGHMMVVTGYVTLNNVNYVYYHNPLPVGAGSSEIRTYTDWVSGSGYSHWDDFYSVTKK
jgi:hypothetical protein